MDITGTANTTIQCNCDEGFARWLSLVNASLAITTYQGGKLLFIGWNGQQPTLHAKNFEKAMGLDVAGEGLLLATRDQLHFYVNIPELATDYPSGSLNAYDALYLPRITYHTGELFIHDVAITEEGFWFVNTLFSCLALSSPFWGFMPQWTPPFITDLAPEDRCHLNGLALCDGKPYAVTALANTNTEEGWRPVKASGGTVMLVDGGEIIIRGLSMPHSPRWHNGNLWVLNSGKGELLKLDTYRGNYDVINRLPGYLRGLGFLGKTAVIGLCKIREKRVFGDLPVEHTYPNLCCGIALVDIFSGEQIGFFEFVNGVEEIYDIRVLEGLRQPNLVGIDDKWAKRVLSCPESLFTISFLKPE